MDSAKGEVSNFQIRSEIHGDPTSGQIWAFRLERFDDDGNRLPPVPVEMRGITAEGIINEGDKVEVYGSWRGGVLIGNSARNLTTNSTVTLKGPNKWFGYFFLICLVIALLFFILIFGSALIHWR